ncbi:oxidoreductase [Micromonospora sonchi]|uniref:Oxidoreductase n=1 Tax=Micromonospora sonchi TaxID=1763543 RepID=A0A917TS48_9ACTN|nr:SDR family NAD(P)-dependent oxidoreductase [Micromonospora sonchi]GGM35652.1 oxidoreductase [Micromonospora sonchi]
MLNGKIALVTGGGAGIGRAIAQAYAKAGASVMVTDIDSDAAAAVASEITESGGTADSRHLDTTDPERHFAVIKYIEERFGRLDIAANNAGVTVPAVPTADLPLDQWEKVRNVDLDGVFYGVRAQIPAMLRAGGGVIVTISSIAGKRGLFGMAPYAAAKHGVIGIMQTIAWEYGQQGIRALSVGPAYIATGLENNIPVEIRKTLPGMHALGRMGEPREVGDTVAWLSSDQASFLTGSYIPVDGGYLAR